MRRIKTVLHIHTNYSPDSNMSPADLLAEAQRAGIGCVGITDHDEIDGAFAAAELASEDVRVIVGEEVSTSGGHLVGIFMTEHVRPGLSAIETAEIIHDQGGLVLAPHPFCPLAGDYVGRHNLQDLLPHLDAFEIHNAQDPLPWFDRRAERFAREHGLTPYVGADVHLRGYLDRCYQTMPDFTDPASFLESLRSATFQVGRYGLAYTTLMFVQHIWSHAIGRPYFGFGGNARRGCTSQPLPDAPAIVPAGRAR